jgi:hypothetical protein
MLPIRSSHLLAALSMILCTSAATAAQTPADEPRESAVRIVTWAVKIRSWPDHVRLDDICRVSHDVRACTDFALERFDCSCERGADGWRIVVDVHVEAVINIINLRHLTHERLHIVEIRESLPSAIGNFLSMRFVSEAGCATLASVMSSPAFTAAVMNRLRSESNARLGCTWRTEETAHESRPSIGRPPRQQASAE